MKLTLLWLQITISRLQKHFINDSKSTKFLLETAPFGSCFFYSYMFPKILSINQLVCEAVKPFEGCKLLPSSCSRIRSTWCNCTFSGCSIKSSVSPSSFERIIASFSKMENVILPLLPAISTMSSLLLLPKFQLPFPVTPDSWI